MISRKIPVSAGSSSRVLEPQNSIRTASIAVFVLHDKNSVSLVDFSLNGDSSDECRIHRSVMAEWVATDRDSLI